MICKLRTGESHPWSESKIGSSPLIYPSTGFSVQREAVVQDPEESRILEKD